MISRAVNTKKDGSVSILAWVWEKQGGYDYRKQTSFENKLRQAMEVPRIDKAIRQRMIAKIEAEAAAEGVYLAGRGEKLSEPAMEAPGVPNWEIEELKSITDGHI